MFLVFRVEHYLQAVERERNIKKRWDPADEEFQSTLATVDQEVRAELLLKSCNEARERAALLQLKRKYPGIKTYFQITLNDLCTLVKNMRN